MTRPVDHEHPVAAMRHCICERGIIAAAMASCVKADNRLASPVLRNCDLSPAGVEQCERLLYPHGTAHRFCYG